MQKCDAKKTRGARVLEYVSSAGLLQRRVLAPKAFAKIGAMILASGKAQEKFGVETYSMYAKVVSIKAV